MTPTDLRVLLERLQNGKTGVEEAFEALKDLPFAELGYAVVDHHRPLRQGAPEVVYAAGKTAEQLVGIARSLIERGANVLMTRIDPIKVAAIRENYPHARHSEVAQTIFIETSTPSPITDGYVAIVTAGTSDLPVAEECSETLYALGVPYQTSHDLGVSGLHRLLAKRSWIAEASVVIVIAGMEGALPSVVGGLVARPVIAVPTSAGYGAAFGGTAALLGMLTSCASGITVCNIDNGFGAAFAAARILRPRP